MAFAKTLNPEIPMLLQQRVEALEMRLAELNEKAREGWRRSKPDTLLRRKLRRERLRLKYEILQYGRVLRRLARSMS